MACKDADKSERGSTGILGAFWTFFISVTGIKFPIWTEDKIRPAYRASPVTGLIWRGANHTSRPGFFFLSAGAGGGGGGIDCAPRPLHNFLSIKAMTVRLGG